MLLTRTITTTNVNHETIELLPFYKGENIMFYNLDESGYLFKIFAYKDMNQVTMFQPGTKSHAEHLEAALVMPDCTEDEFLDALSKVFPNRESGIVPLRRAI